MAVNGNKNSYNYIVPSLTLFFKLIIIDIVNDIRNFV